MTIDDDSIRISDAKFPEASAKADYASLVDELVTSMLRTSGTRLRVDAEVARGGFGAIQAVHDAVLERTLAKKSLLAAGRDNPILVRAFLREASITAQLDHPNIVPVHDFGVDAEGQLYFTMKLVRGQTLEQRIADLHASARAGKDGYERMLSLVEILVRVCDALAFAHSRGVIHCDLKADNVMVGRFGQVYLMDWGFAQILPPRAGQELEPRVRDPLPPLPAQLTEGLAFGTPSTMSPEQAYARTDELDERSDVFSLGAILYHVVASHPLYHRGTPLERVRCAQERQFDPLLPSVDAAVPRPAELVAIIERALAWSPGQRYQSVEEMADELKRVLRGGAPPSVRFEAGAIIVAEGETADAAYLVESGQCEVFVTRGGRRVRLEQLEVGDLFGEGALLPLTRRLVGVAAVTAVTLLRVPGTMLDHEFGSRRPWVSALIKGLARRARTHRERELRARPGRRWWRPW